ncbi:MULTISPECIES: Xaa-Pro peptidase family protein [Acidaminococcus]|nr:MULTISPECIES: M24 family metallopeptidase [Acidaminococcus]
MMKIVKDEYEISCIRKSAELVDMGVKTTIDYLTQGYSEAEASTEGQYAMRKLWHQKYRDSEVCGYGTSEGGMIDSLHVWCLSENHISYGCDAPKHYYPKEGDLTLPMAWAKTDGYHAENERTIIIGGASEFKNHAYDSMLHAREAVFSILKPGILFKELYFAAAKVYSDAGFENILPGRIGHGCGCSAHEFPSLAPNNEIPLAPGMVITIEPGLMDKKWGGVRHSDTVLITEDGYERLTKLDNGRIVIHPTHQA